MRKGGMNTIREGGTLDGTIRHKKEESSASVIVHGQSDQSSVSAPSGTIKNSKVSPEILQMGEKAGTISRKDSSLDSYAFEAERKRKDSVLTGYAPDQYKKEKPQMAEISEVAVTSPVAMTSTSTGSNSSTMSKHRESAPASISGLSPNSSNTAKIQPIIFKASRICRLGRKVICSEYMQDVLLIGLDEGLFAFDSEDMQNPKMIPLSVRKYLQMDYSDEFGLISRSGKHNSICLHDTRQIDKQKMKKRFEEETKVKKLKEIKDCDFYTISKIFDDNSRS
jgi:hypothetical protein